MDLCHDVVCILETVHKNAYGSGVTVEITPHGFCFKIMHIGCQNFIVPLLDFHEMWCVGMYNHITEFQMKCIPIVVPVILSF